MQKANEVHSNKYDYSMIDYKKSQEYITIICKKHGEFQQKENNHLQMEK